MVIFNSIFEVQYPNEVKSRHELLQSSFREISLSFGNF